MAMNIYASHEYCLGITFWVVNDDVSCADFTWKMVSNVGATCPTCELIQSISYWAGLAPMLSSIILKESQWFWVVGSDKPT
jgi:hypothetical protein